MEKNLDKEGVGIKEQNVKMLSGSMALCLPSEYNDNQERMHSRLEK
jgi:hypothetical protein